MAGEPLTPEELARLSAVSGPPRPPGMIYYEQQPIVRFGPERGSGAQVFTPPVPPPVAAPRQPLSFVREQPPAIEPDAFAASRGAAQQNRARKVAEAAAPPLEVAAHAAMQPEPPPPATPPPTPPADAAAPEAPGGGPVAAPIAPLQVIPGGWAPHHRVGRLEVDEGTKEEYVGADALHEQAIQQKTDADQARYDAEAKQIVDTERRVRAIDNAVARNESDRAAQIQSQQIKLEELTDKVNKAPEIDSGRFWAKKSTGAKLFAILGVALGGFAAGMRGGQNQAIDLWEKEMDRDLEAQKAQAANAGNKLAQQRGLLGQMKENFNDTRQAEAAAKVAYLGRAELQLKALAAQSQSPEVQARATDLLAQLQERRAARQLEFDKLAQGNLTEVYRPPTVVGGGGPKPDPEKEKLFVPTGPNGAGYYARTEDEAKKHRAAREGAAELEEVINKALAIRAKTGALERGVAKAGLYDTEDMSSLQSLQTQAGTALNKMKGMGTWDAGSSKAADEQVGKLLNVTGNPEAAARSLLGITRHSLVAAERSQAGQGARAAIAVDQQGRPVQVTLGQASMASPKSQMPPGFKPLQGEAVENVPSPQKAAEPELVVGPAAKKKRGK